MERATLSPDLTLSRIVYGARLSLAVALAAKDSLQHFFGSLVILADKPFELGERAVRDPPVGIFAIGEVAHSYLDAPFHGLCHQSVGGSSVEVLIHT